MRAIDIITEKNKLMQLNADKQDELKRLAFEKRRLLLAPIMYGNREMAQADLELERMRLELDQMKMELATAAKELGVDDSWVDIAKAAEAGRKRNNKENADRKKRITVYRKNAAKVD